MLEPSAARTRSSLSSYRPATLVLAGTLVLYGISFNDRIDFAAIVSEPLAAKVDASRQFLFSSPLWFWIGVPFAHVFNPTKAYAITIAIGLCALALGLLAWLRTLPAEHRPAALAGLQLSPFPVVALSWLGKSDTLLAGLYFVHTSIRRSSSARFVVAVLLVLAHQEIGTVVLASDAILRRRVLWPTLAGLIAARFVIFVYQANVDGLVLTRIGLGLSFAGRAGVGWATDPVSHIALGIGWVWLLVARRRRTSDRSTVFACLVLAYAAAATVADFTRVTVLCALPIIVHLAASEAADPAERAWLGSAAVAGLSLIQLQLADFDLLHDSSWPQYVLKTFRGMSWW